MSTKQRDIHRGELLKAALAASPLSVTKLTKRMGISRGTYYNHVLDPELSLDLLERYGKILGHDFTQDLPAMRRYTLEEPDAPYGGQPKNLKEAVEQRDYWKDKYYALMDRFHQLLLEGNAKDKA